MLVLASTRAPGWSVRAFVLPSIPVLIRASRYEYQLRFVPGFAPAKERRCPAMEVLKAKNDLIDRLQLSAEFSDNPI
jgi:hypothetical protein